MASMRLQAQIHEGSMPICVGTDRGGAARPLCEGVDPLYSLIAWLGFVDQLAGTASRSSFRSRSRSTGLGKGALDWTA